MRHYGHTWESRHKDNGTNTKLATYVCDERDEGVEIKKVKWEILKSAKNINQVVGNVTYAYLKN